MGENLGKILPKVMPKGGSVVEHFKFGIQLKKMHEQV